MPPFTRQAKRSPTLTMWSRKLFESTLLRPCKFIFTECTCVCLLWILLSNLYYFNSFSLNRKCIKTTTLSDKLTIPKGTIVILGVYLLQHDPKYWDDPEKFNPDRLACFMHNTMHAQQISLTGIYLYIFKVCGRGESQATNYCSHAIWFWSSQLHWDEVCSAGG